MTKKLAVYIGRFSPVHNGHMEIIRHALKTYDHLLIIVGSSNISRSIKNPFSFGERVIMLRSSIIELCGEEAIHRVTFSAENDYPYNDTIWLNKVNSRIELAKWTTNSDEVFLTGSDRDDSTYYFKYFHNLNKDLSLHNEGISKALSATVIREIYFGSIFNSAPIDNITKDILTTAFLPKASLNFLAQFKISPAYSDLVEEFEYIKNYKKQWSDAPYAPTFVTTDAVVTQDGFVLLVRRKASPGKGLYALPGGFVEQNEFLLDGVIRELREETKLKVPVPVLKGSLKRKEIFDKPDRSLRGRTITVAYHFALAELNELPKVKGGDDAQSAEWVLLSKLPELKTQFFEDHASIIETFIGG